jgi:hypothetical protein
LASNARGTFSATRCTLAAVGSVSGSCSVIFTLAPGDPATVGVYANYGGNTNYEPSHASARIAVH